MTPVGYRVLDRTAISLAAPSPSTSYSVVFAQLLEVVGWGAGVLQVELFNKNITGNGSTVRIAVYNVMVDRDDPSVTFESVDPIAYVDITVGTSSAPELFVVRLPTVADAAVALGRQVSVKMIVNAGPNSIAGTLTLGVQLFGYRGMVGPKGLAGVNAYANSTASFTAPAANATATLTAADCSWCAAGQRVFLSYVPLNVVGYFRVATNGTATSVDLINEDGSQAGVAFPAGSKLSPSGENGAASPGAYGSLYSNTASSTWTALTGYGGDTVTPSGMTTSTSSGSITANVAGVHRVSADLLIGFSWANPQVPVTEYVTLTKNGAPISGAFDVYTIFGAASIPPCWARSSRSIRSHRSSAPTAIASLAGTIRRACFARPRARRTSRRCGPTAIRATNESPAWPIRISPRPASRAIHTRWSRRSAPKSRRPRRT